jgi:hypothetical protein
LTLPGLLRAAESTGFAVTVPQPQGLVRGLQLRPYQLQALSWMVEQESDAYAGVAGLNGYLWEKRSFSSHPSEFFYYFALSGQLMLDPPPVVTGGLLAEEMGVRNEYCVLTCLYSF